MKVLRRLGVGLITLLTLFSTVFLALAANPQRVSAAPVYNYDTDLQACVEDGTQMLGIVESDDVDAGSLIYHWCHVSGTTYEFSRNGSASDTILVDIDNPAQGTLTSASGTQNINVADSEFLEQYATTQAAGQQAGNQDDSQSCESIGVMGWIVCPFVSFVSGAISWLDERMQELLKVGEDRYANPELHHAWTNFRNIAYMILIPVMLIMVIGTALDATAFSAYTVKKALPRMVAAIIFITLSWHITTFLIGFFNTVGSGILGLMTSPFGVGGNMSLESMFGVSSENFGDVASTVGSSITQWALLLGPLAGLAVMAITPGGLAILVLYLVPAIIFVLGAFLVLTIREIFILVAVLFAPLAILSWIFPGNDKLWKLWWGTFSKLLLMFPLIMMVLGAGRVFAYLIDISGGGGLQSLITPILKLTAYLLPYMFIPYAFKFAGGLISNLAGMVDNRGKSLSDRSRKLRGSIVKSKYKDALNNKLYKGAKADGSKLQQWKFSRNEKAQRWASMPAAYQAGGATGVLSAAWKEFRRDKTGFDNAKEKIDNERQTALDGVDRDQTTLNSRRKQLQDSGRYDAAAARDYDRENSRLEARRNNIESRYTNDLRELANSSRAGSGVVSAAVQVKKNENLKELLEDQAFSVYSGFDDVSGLAAAIISGDFQGLRTRIADKSGLEGTALDATMNSLKDKIGRGGYSDALRTSLRLTKSFDTLDANGNVVEDTAGLEANIGHFERDLRRFDRDVYARALIEKAVGGGTYYVDAADQNRAIALATSGDGAAQSDLVARLRGVATKAGRAESGSGSFGATMGLNNALRSLDQRLANGGISQAEYEVEVGALQVGYMEHSLDNTHASTLFHSSMKDSYIRNNLIPVIQSKVANLSEKLAIAGRDYGEDSRQFAEAKDNYVSLLATVDNIHQSTLSSKPKIAKDIGDKIMGMEIPVFVPAQPAQPEHTDARGNVIPAQPAQPARIVSKSVLGQVGTFQTDADYQRYHREFQNAARAAEADMQRAAMEAAVREAGGSDPGAGPNTGI